METECKGLTYLTCCFSLNKFRIPCCFFQGEVADSPKRGLTTVNFATSVPMSSYLACFIVCDFEHLPSVKSKRGFDVTVYARSGQIHKMQYALKIAASTVDFYIDYFGIDYPLPKLGLF